MRTNALLSRAVGMSDIAQTLQRAAKGENEAQSALLDYLVHQALQPGAIVAEPLASIELLGRMLASHGRPQDKVRLAGILIFRAAVVRGLGMTGVAEAMIAEGMHLFSEAVALGLPDADTQQAELSRRLHSNHSIPGEVMLGDVAPLLQ